jgi:hypothetical protein
LATVLARRGESDAALDAYATGIGEAIDYGNSTHAATILRNLVALLVDMGDSRSASILLGALDGDGVKATYGSEARRLSAAHGALATIGSSRERDQWIAQGASLRLDEALLAARAAVKALRS